MAKHGGYGGGMPGNMANLMKQAQRMQAEMQEQQAAFEEKEFTAAAGGGAVTAVMNGKKEIKSLTIAPEVVDPDDIEMLQDLIITAINENASAIDAEQAANMQRLTGGLGGLF